MVVIELPMREEKVVLWREILLMEIVSTKIELPIRLENIVLPVRTELMNACCVDTILELILTPVMDEKVISFV